MRGDPVDRNFGCVGGKSFPANLTRGTAVQGIGGLGAQFAKVELVHAPADFFVRRETDAHQSVLEIPVPEQLLHQGHHHRHARFVIRSQQRGAACGNDVFAARVQEFRRSRGIQHEARIIRKPDGLAIVGPMNNRLHAFAGAIGGGVNMGQERDRGHVRLPRRGGNAGHHVAVLVHPPHPPPPAQSTPSSASRVTPIGRACWEKSCWSHPPEYQAGHTAEILKATYHS